MAADTTLAQATGTASQAAAPTAPVAAAPEAKTNFFSEGFKTLGNHHVVDVMPFGEIPLPYIFVDHGSFHYYASAESLKESGIYSTNTDPKFDPEHTIETSPLAEKGSVVRLDHKPIGLDLSVTSNLFFLGFAGLLLAIFATIAASKAKKTLIPSGIRNLFEVLIVFVRDDVVAPNVAEPF